MRGTLIKVLKVCVIVAVIILSGYFVYNSYFASKTTKAAPAYYTVSAEKMNLKVTVQGTGTAYAEVAKDVVPGFNGILKELNVKVGDTVTAGQKLFSIDSDEVKKSVTSAENNLAKQKLALAIDQNSGKADENKIAVDNLAIRDAQTQLDNAYKQLDKTNVTAPITGTIISIGSANGDSVQSNKSILSIVDMSSIRVKVSVDELNITKVKTGQSATVNFSAIKDKAYEGSVETISEIGTTSNNVTTYGVVVAVKDPAGIKLGMNADVVIQVESKENALVIPKEALIVNESGKFVMLEQKKNSGSAETDGVPADQQEQKADQTTEVKGGVSANESQNNLPKGKLIAVKTGLENEDYVEIVEGLTEGQKIIVELPDTTSSNDKNNQKKVKDLSGGNTAAKQPKTGNKK